MTDNDPASKPKAAEHNQVLSAEKRGSLDLQSGVQHYLPNLVDILLHPKNFFASFVTDTTAPQSATLDLSNIAAHPKQSLMALVNDPELGQPTVFLFISTTICAILQIITGNGWNGIASFFGNVIGTYLVSIFTTIVLTFFTNRGDYRNTFKIFAYSEIALLVAWIGPFHIGAMAATIYSLCLQIIGIRKVYQLPLGQVTVLMMIITLVTITIKGILGVSSL
jgi:hypothetical protein